MPESNNLFLHTEAGVSTDLSCVSADDVTALANEFEASCSATARESVLCRMPGLAIGYLVRLRTPNAGTILQHCKARALSFRRRIGIQVCVFKFGFTSNPIIRFSRYQQLHYSNMLLLHVTSCKGAAQMLEAALIDQHMGLTGCRNEQLGGEGPGHIEADAYYVYIVSARADQPKPIG